MLRLLKLQQTHRLFFPFFLFVTLLNSKAQQVHDIPLNYPGLLAGIEWNTLSGLTGVEYERTLLTRHNVTAGIKGSYMFRYRTGNMQILNRPCCSMSSLATALATADLFTTQKGYPSGFFLHAGLGIGMKRYDTGVSPDLVNVRPAFEAGAGWLFLIGRGLALKWTNTVTFPSRDGGITISRLAFGF